MGAAGGEQGPAAGGGPLDRGGNASRHPGALDDVRICDLSGQLAGAGATRVLAAFGAQVIRIEDPVKRGMWDIVRQLGPRLHGDPGPEGGSGFNNHNVEKLGVTLNLRTERGRDLLARLVGISHAVTENFAAGVMDRLGFGYERLCELRPGIVYVSNSGFGYDGPYHSFKSWGPIAQAMSGLTHTSALPGREPAGWGYSYMDHSGAYMMAIALLSALYHQRRTGEGQWVDIACAETGITLAGLAALDATVNGRAEREVPVASNRSTDASMAPHGVFGCAGDDSWVAIACRHDEDWRALARVVAEPWAADQRFAQLPGRLAAQDELDLLLEGWTRGQARDDVVPVLRSVGVPCAPVLRPAERCDANPDNDAWGLWPTVNHALHGVLRVDGLPIHLSATDWHVERGGPVLGQDNERVLSEILGLSSAEIARLSEDGVI
ncbi:MAG TPA: CoA transferase [Acidimicrobiales bacterium]|nr:CoA transferase [Acidimicrobiales bacterium]